MNFLPWILAAIGIGMVMMTVFIVIQIRSWNIPVVNFKVVGDRRRPVLDTSKRAKIVTVNGVSKLKFRGTPLLWEMRNFKSENYYQTTSGRQGLVTLEFAKNCYTPLQPSLLRRMLGAQPAEVEEVLPVFVPVDVRLTDETIQSMALKAVDDFDPDFIIRNHARIDTQYVGGWRAFLKEFGWIIGWLLLFMLAIVGIVLFFQKAPELAAACAKAGLEGGKSVIEKMSSTIPAG